VDIVNRAPISPFPLVLVQSQMLRIYDHLKAADGVRHMITGRLSDLTPLLTGLDVRSRDFQ